MTQQPGDDVAGIEILSKAGAVVDALASAGTLSVVALAESVGEPTSSTYRLVQSLTALGWVESAPPRGMYRLGLAFLQIGGALEASLDVRHVALPRMRELRNAMDVAVLLCYRRDVRAVCVERIDGHDVRSVAMQVGDSLPLHAGAAPMALLSWLPAGEQHAILDRLSADATSFSESYPVPSHRALHSEMSHTRRRGYARSDQNVTIGIAALGAPVFNHRGELVAALSISGLRESLLDREEEMADSVMTTARQISTDLGFEGAADA